METKKQEEIVEGYVLDIACIRAYPQEELQQRARVHTTKCSLMGHCVESGYGLVGTGGQLVLLDPKATPKVVDVLTNSKAEQGVYLRVSRTQNGEKMETVSVEKVQPDTNTAPAQRNR